MILDAFFRRPSRRGKGTSDDLDRLIAVIESFAPKQFQKERAAYYYNYRTLDAYRGKLSALLESLGKGRGRHEEAVFGREVFLRLKAFYDLRDTLSDAQALADPALKRKFRELFRYFYGKEGPRPSIV